jgi:antibiotic biosynthesis monooxygenase (ABM) superfamily enzyme
MAQQSASRGAVSTHRSLGRMPGLLRRVVQERPAALYQGVRRTYLRARLDKTGDTMADTSGEIDLRQALPTEIEQLRRRRSEMVTSVIEHTVKPGSQADYENWLKRIAAIAERFPGHLGISYVAPIAGSTTYTLVLRFDTLEHAQDWFQSAARKSLVAEIEPHLQTSESIDIETGLEFWFRTPPGAKPPSRFKQSLVTLGVLYPLTLILPPLVSLSTGWSQWLSLGPVRTLMTDALVVGLLSYVLMPRVTRLLSRWLYA